MMDKVCAQIERRNDGTYCIWAKRAKFKHWFKLGTNRTTDVAFERALMQGKIMWKGEIQDATKIFQKK